VRPIVDLVPNAAQMRFEVVPGGHLGMLTGRAARTTTWRVLDEWITENSTPESAPSTRSPARKTPAKKSPTKTPAAKNAPAQKAPAKNQASAKRTAASADAIGANPNRRYASASSRGLGTKK
jgi:polyhydroxyalkanoate synthase